MSLRTLQRKLEEENTSYSALSKSVRKEMAHNYIQDSQLSINEISYLLGFAEQANFTRAFKRWYGESPSEYRKLSQTIA
jgi:AraC-like DNA-binding protein